MLSFLSNRCDDPFQLGIKKRWYWLLILPVLLGGYYVAWYVCSGLLFFILLGMESIFIVLLIGFNPCQHNIFIIFVMLFFCVHLLLLYEFVGIVVCIH